MNSFANLRDDRRYDLAIIGIGAYDPWIRSHCTPEQAIAMANAAGARFVMPVHHQTFKLSFEPFREPIERFTAALADEPERIALCEIGETLDAGSTRRWLARTSKPKDAEGTCELSSSPHMAASMGSACRRLNSPRRQRPTVSRCGSAPQV